MSQSQTSSSDFPQPTPISGARIGLSAAIRRHWVAALLPVVVLTLAAALVGVARNPTYTAESRLIIGGIDLSQPGALAGFAVASQSLASAYSRTVDAAGVINQVSQKTGVEPEAARKSLSATPIAESPVFKVTATADSAKEAIRLANAGGDAVVAYTTELNRSRPEARRIRDDYRRALLRRDLLQRNLRSLTARYQGDPSPENLNRLDRATAEVGDAAVRLAALRVQYQNNQQGQTTAGLVQVLSPADDASDDRLSKLQLLLFAGVIGGLLFGAALAILLATGDVRRAVARPR